MFRKSIIYLFSIFFKIYFAFIKSQFNRNYPIWIVDIDNTIADTWVELLPSKTGNSMQRLYRAKPLIGMQRLLQNTLNTNILYLSARNNFHFPLTLLWLKKFGFPNYKNLILVDTPSSKISYLKEIIEAEFPQIKFFDDLSHGQENGHTLFYEDTISRINEMPIDYVGYEELKKINQVKADV